MQSNSEAKVSIPAVDISAERSTHVEKMLIADIKLAFFTHIRFITSSAL